MNNERGEKTTKPKNGRPKRGENAWSDTLAFVAARERGTGELVERLEKLGHSAEKIKECVEKALKLGFVDDARASFSAVLGSGRGRGNRAVEARLSKRGFSRDETSTAMTKASEEGRMEPEENRALEVARKKFPNGISTTEEKKKAWGFLARRGFSGKSVSYVITRLSPSFDPDDDVFDS